MRNASDLGYGVIDGYIVKPGDWILDNGREIVPFEKFVQEYDPVRPRHEWVVLRKIETKNYKACWLDIGPIRVVLENIRGKLSLRIHR